ncbi:MAG TPA: DUF4158 domain-containing protein, partial [Clostridium sp.]
MKRNWDLEELIDYFTFMPNELRLIGNKTGETRLGFAVILKFFRNEARFPNNKNEIPKAVISYIAKQFKVSSELFSEYNIESRSFYYHKSQIREFFGFKESTVEESEVIIKNLFNHILSYDMEHDYLKEEIYKKFRELKIDPPAIQRIERIINSNIYNQENEFFNKIYRNLPKECLLNIDKLIAKSEEK